MQPENESGQRDVARQSGAAASGSVSPEVAPEGTVDASNGTMPQHSRRGLWLLGGLSFVLAATLAILLAQLRFENPAFAALLVFFAVCALAGCICVNLLLDGWKHRRSAVAAAAATAIIVGLLLGFLQLRPEPANEATGNKDTDVTPHTPLASSPPSQSNSPSPDIAPTMMSEGPTQRVEEGVVSLNNAESAVVSSWGLRIAASSLYSSFIHARISTDAGTCDAFLDVGEPIVLTNRQSGESDYSQWYAATLEKIEDGVASIAWAVGTGSAPAADHWNSCT